MKEMMAVPCWRKPTPHHVLGGLPRSRDDMPGKYYDRLAGDAMPAVHELKATEGGELQVHGSAGLVASLHAAGLIDELRLLVFPVTVGAG